MRLLPLLLLAACFGDVGEGKVKAVVEDAPAVAAEAQVVASNGLPVPAVKAPTVVPVDVRRSSLGAIGAKITATHPIAFPDFAGSVGLDGDTVTGVAFATRIDKLESSPARLTEHLKNEDFLDAPKYPFGTFASTEVRAGSDEPGFDHTVVGDLTLRGVTKRVTFPARITVTPGEVTADTEFVINRQDFGITYKGKADNLVQDNVVMKVSFVAAR